MYTYYIYLHIHMHIHTYVYIYIYVCIHTYDIYVQVLVIEWVPFGANQIVALNYRLGAFDRCDSTNI